MTVEAKIARYADLLPVNNTPNTCTNKKAVNNIFLDFSILEKRSANVIKRAQM